MNNLSERLFEEAQDNPDTLYWKASQEIDRLKSELDAAKDDAERYRWLRDRGYLNSWWSVQDSSNRGVNIDADIDQAIFEDSK